nr:DNA-(apurinic or apyrimidinic site) lyase [Ipomoea batatas]
MSSNYSGSGEWIPEVRCWCGEIAPVRMSWSYANPGKRFRACPHYGVRGNGNCRYFQWLDSDVSDRVAKVIRGLLKRLDKQDIIHGGVDLRAREKGGGVLAIQHFSEELIGLGVDEGQLVGEILRENRLRYSHADVSDADDGDFGVTLGRRQQRRVLYRLEEGLA